MERDTMRAVVVTGPGDIEMQDVPVPDLQDDEILVNVEASGLCHSDISTVQGHHPKVNFPRIPGHEVAGTVAAVGNNVTNVSAGERVGIGWNGGYCGRCDSCRRGALHMCENGEVTGVTRDGGHAEYMVADERAVAKIPEALGFPEAAPLMCAGVTTFNALRNSDITPGETVAIVGVGGLGHLAVQYADALGCEVVAADTSLGGEYVTRLGADHYVDASEHDLEEELQRIGGADYVLVTAPSSEAIEQSVAGLAQNGEVCVVGIPEENPAIDVLKLISERAKVSGWSSGHAKDSEDTMNFSALKGIRPDIETFDLERYPEAYERMMDGDVRSRGVMIP